MRGSCVVLAGALAFVLNELKTYGSCRKQISRKKHIRPFESRTKYNGGLASGRRPSRGQFPIFPLYIPVKQTQTNKRTVRPILKLPFSRVEHALNTGSDHIGHSCTALFGPSLRSTWTTARSLSKLSLCGKLSGYLTDL